MWVTGRGCGSGSGSWVVGCGSGSWVGVVVRGQGRESGLWVGVGAVGHGLCVGVVGRGRGRGLWVVGRAEVLFVGFWQSALGGMAAPRGTLALWSLGGWPGPWHRAPAPALLPARPPLQSRPSEPWAGPQGRRPCASGTGAEDPEPGKLLHAVWCPRPQVCPLAPAGSSAWIKHSSPVCSAPLGSLSQRWGHHGTQHGTYKRDFRFLAAA